MMYVYILCEMNFKMIRGLFDCIAPGERCIVRSLPTMLGASSAFRDGASSVSNWNLKKLFVLMFIDVLFQILHLQYPFNRVVPVINFQYSFLEVIFAHMQNTRTHALSLVTEPNNALNVDRVSHGRLLEECYYIKCEATNQSSHLSESSAFGVWSLRMQISHFAVTVNSTVGYPKTPPVNSLGFHTVLSGKPCSFVRGDNTLK